MAHKKTHKRKGTDLLQAPDNHVAFRNSAVKRVHYTTTDDTGSSTSTSIRGRIPIPQSAANVSQRNDIESQGLPEPESSDSPEQRKRTQNGQLLDDFEDHFEELGMLLLEYEADEETGLVCECGSGMERTTQCYDCTGYAAACSTCFIKAHLRIPFHWAEVWNTLTGFFVRHDISKLGHVIQLGHNGDRCEQPTGERLFTVVDGNGIHSTRLAFCGCREQPPNKIRQLMRSRLFPATTKDPHTAFTVNMLKEFQMHNFESKKAAYDYLGAIRRLSDDSFTADVANPYAAFLRVVRVFNYLTLKKRCGQFHGIDILIPHRPVGNLLVWCPACPEPGLNSDPNCPTTPADLRRVNNYRHLNQSQRTLDGNHQCNQFSKNTDPDDVSLCAGKAYFPLDSTYQQYLKSVPTSTAKATCNYLKVVNKQDKKKFKNMAITGTVNSMALRNHKPSEEFTFKLQIEVDDVDEAATYDIACEYVINLEKRFETYFPDQLASIKKMRWGVPALHVQGHQDSCTYLFGTGYMECIGHFHGETAEHYWPEANQLGPHIRQMNLGHRQDTMINHHGDWNYKKTMKIASDLAEDLQAAKRKYLEKRNHYIGLSISFKDRVAEWQKTPRKTYKQGKEAVIPSQLSIYQAMLAQDDNFASTLVPKSKIAKFLDEGLKIQDNQLKLKHLIQDTTEHDLQAWRKEIAGRTSKLRDQIAAFRRDQKHFMAKVGDKVAAQTALGTPIEDEKLFLPSGLTGNERQKMDIVALGMEESKWREGQAFDILRALQHIVKTISALRNRKFKNDRQQKQNSRAGDQIAEATKRQNYRIESYSAARLALISLNGSTDFPVLTEADLFMKSVQQKRRVGDSKRTDGLLWRATALATIGSYDSEVEMGELEQPEEGGDQAAVAGTQMDRRKSGAKPKKIAEKSNKDEMERPEGWLWQLGKLTKISNTEMEAWSNEGDRVQWFRAEAEMQRWQEQWEQKLVELLRTRRSFGKMESVWAQLADMQPSEAHGAKAYARQKAAMYARRKSEAEIQVKKVGYGQLLDETANVVALVEAERKTEAAVIDAALNGIAQKLRGHIPCPEPDQVRKPQHSCAATIAITFIGPEYLGERPPEGH
ncbi:hypothetical protein B0H11DRAFT_1924017 [Mycena galericulata]|nr:hypothetical protein B0H11DRAFT_1924017 [Mycena galericulata]